MGVTRQHVDSVNLQKDDRDDGRRTRPRDNRRKEDGGQGPVTSNWEERTINTLLQRRAGLIPSKKHRIYTN